MKHRQLIHDPIERTAILSACRKYRYELIRSWDEGPTLNYIATNPSSADETIDDPTIRVMMHRARRLGYGRIVVTNIFCWRSSDPYTLRHLRDPFGPECDSYLLKWAREADTVLCCWGQGGLILQRGMRVRQMLGRLDVDLWALKVSAGRRRMTGGPFSGDGPGRRLCMRQEQFKDG